MDLLEVNLREGKVTTHPWDEASLDRVREHIRLSVRSMKAYLKDPERNLAEEADFEKTEELRICRWCNFRAVCRPELPPFAALSRGGGRGRDRGMKALLVDLDDTLLDYSGGVDECWLHACEALAGPAGIDPPGLVGAIAETRRWFWSDPGRHRTRAHRHARAPGRRITAHALDRLGRPDEALAAAIAEDFAERRWERMTLFPGVTEALEAAARPRRPAGPGHQRRRDPSAAQDRAHDLERFFDVIVIEGEIGVGKPEEVVYRYALSKLGVKAAEAWMVGDNLEWDVLAPQRLGLRGVWVDAPGEGLPKSCSVAPHRIIRAFPELLE